MDNSSALSSDPSTDSYTRIGEDIEDQVIVSAVFADHKAAQDAVRELREVGIEPNSISLISRDEDHTSDPGLSGSAVVPRGEVRDEHRAPEEPPNDEEDQYATAPRQTGYPEPLVTDFEVPPDDVYGGAERLGLTPDRETVSRDDAETSADKDSYAGIQEPLKNHTSTAHSAAVGAGLGSIGGLLIGMASLAIPGVGPFIAAGPLVGALTGLVAGSVAGSIMGALSAIGVPEEYAREYAARIQQGDTLISVRADELSQDLVERVLVANGGEAVQCARREP
jgi:hypothetical protein